MATMNDINDDKSKITKKEYARLKTALNEMASVKWALKHGAVICVHPNKGVMITFSVTQSAYDIDDIIEIPYNGPNGEWEKPENFLLLHITGTTNDILLRIV